MSGQDQSSELGKNRPKVSLEGGGVTQDTTSMATVEASVIQTTDMVS